MCIKAGLQGALSSLGSSESAILFYRIKEDPKIVRCNVLKFHVKSKVTVISRVAFEKKIMFYTEILTRKVELWIFSLVSLVKKHHKTTFPVKISV